MLQKSNCLFFGNYDCIFKNSVSEIRFAEISTLNIIKAFGFCFYLKVLFEHSKITHYKYIAGKPPHSFKPGLMPTEVFSLQFDIGQPRN